jgi:hypothetical protein
MKIKVGKQSGVVTSHLFEQVEQDKSGEQTKSKMWAAVG